MNKRYITITLALLSLAGYMQNVALEIETDADSAKNSTPLPQKVDILEKYKDKVCEDFEEISMAVKHANETAKLLLKLSETSIDNYSPYFTQNKNKIIYSKKFGNIDLGRFHFTIPSPSKYSDVIEKLWDFDGTQKSDPKFINGHLTRVYAPFLIMMEQSNINQENSSFRKKLALAAKVKQSNDTTVIVCPSRILNYLGEIDQKTNLIEIFEDTRSIETGISPEGALIKLRANIAGYVIKQKNDSVHVTYINSIYDDPRYTESIYDRRNRGMTYSNLLAL
ncbi:hypothetical protein YYC_04126 [Plasmodium yoelii 17X]|uniref:Fam-a protein n=4 Tax=Plasmodium yoelii TaxID=5861 RepID=A0AAE9WS42_PLAYO|nr:fam-a protein [Plasmodium yoelii]EAA18715.1 hypothetical protein [Plasmodium yoelii yoelii]ETB58033.1 hypothetical protein YYC_04126 [Plasmodium yoelii 17X]WBY58991.1 fam-a protein [Plasmodium yoelii yoelii]CDU19186.1 fam-a protein [Plasmodium yoelii]VTZ79821.1 fam-a protein [Plasmodium yoelii]|eukprot:XP_727150.1 fam-a protein [Plasmodium yoelii]